MLVFSAYVNSNRSWGSTYGDIQLILKAEDHLQALHEEFHAETPTGRRREIVVEGMRVTDELRTQVAEKLEKVRVFLEELDKKAERYQTYLTQSLG